MKFKVKSFRFQSVLTHDPGDDPTGCVGNTVSLATSVERFDEVFEEHGCECVQSSRDSADMETSDDSPWDMPACHAWVRGPLLNFIVVQSTISRPVALLLLGSEALVPEF